MLWIFITEYWDVREAERARGVLHREPAVRSGRVQLPLQSGHDAEEEEADHVRASARPGPPVHRRPGAERQDVAAVLEAPAPALRLQRERRQRLLARRHPAQTAGEEAAAAGRAPRHRGGDQAGQAQAPAPQRRQRDGNPQAAHSLLQEAAVAQRIHRPAAAHFRLRSSRSASSPSHQSPSSSSHC